MIERESAEAGNLTPYVSTVQTKRWLLKTKPKKTKIRRQDRSEVAVKIRCRSFLSENFDCAGTQHWPQTLLWSLCRRALYCVVMGLLWLLLYRTN